MESNHVPLDTLSVEFAVLPPHSQVLLFPNPLVVLQLAVHLPLNVLPLLRARAGLQCPASLSRSHFLLLSAGECPHQCLSQRHNATDWQTHCVYTNVKSVYRYMRLACKTKWYSDLLIQLLDTVIHYVSDGCCSECPTMSYLLYLSLSWVIYIYTSLTVTSSRNIQYILQDSQPGLGQRWCCCQPLRKWQAFRARQH